MALWLLTMCRLAGGGALAILTAILWDLAVGVRKAKLRGEQRTSYGLSRTATKLLTYYGAYGVGLCIDSLLHFGRVWELLGIDKLNGVPIIALLIGVFLCVVEILSIRESADEKMRKRFNAAEATLIKAASKGELVEMLAKAIAAAQESGKGNDAGGE